MDICNTPAILCSLHRSGRRILIQRCGIRAGRLKRSYRLAIDLNQRSGRGSGHRGNIERTRDSLRARIHWRCHSRRPREWNRSGRIRYQERNGCRCVQPIRNILYVRFSCCARFLCQTLLGVGSRRTETRCSRCRLCRCLQRGQQARKSICSLRGGAWPRRGRLACGRHGDEVHVNACDTFVHANRTPLIPQREAFQSENSGLITKDLGRMCRSGK